MAAGWPAAAPRDALTLLPAVRRRARVLDVLARRPRRRPPWPSPVSDPLGRAVQAAVLVDGRRRATAYVESAQACGLHLLAADERDPPSRPRRASASSLLAALDEGRGASSSASAAAAPTTAAPGCSPRSAPARRSLARGGRRLAARPTTPSPACSPARAARRTSSWSPPPTSTSRCSASRARRGVRPAEGRHARGAQVLEGALGRLTASSRAPCPRPRTAHRRTAPARREPGAGAAGRPRLRPAPARRAPGQRVELVLGGRASDERRRGQRPGGHGGGDLRLAEPAAARSRPGSREAALGAGLPVRRARRTGPRRAAGDAGAGISGRTPSPRPRGVDAAHARPGRHPARPAARVARTWSPLGDPPSGRTLGGRPEQIAVDACDLMHDHRPTRAPTITGAP